jgi:hypothetical protein
MIFLCFSGDHDALIETEMCGFGDYRASTVGNMEFVRLEAPSMFRTKVAGLDPSITLLPGPNGTLTDEHIPAVAGAVPYATAGMTMLGFLSLLYAATQNPSFDPDGI